MNSFNVLYNKRGNSTVLYSPGMRVVIRDEEWLVKKVDHNTFGHQVLQVNGLSRLVKDREAFFLCDLEEISIVNPEETRLVPDDSSFFTKSRLFIESQWRQKTPTDEQLHVGHNAAMNLMPYQLEPTKIALSKPRQRILIADAVGLGKTLEAGILMSELIARGRGKRILVVTVKSMMTQFQKEMWSRFTIPLIRLDSTAIQRIKARIPTNYNPFYYYDKTIVSIDTLKRDIAYRTHLENAWWDIIVIDEAHNVAERGKSRAQRSRLASLLSERSDTLIMLSATPHDGKAESFASLMNMLDPTAIADPSKYTKEDIHGMCVRRFKKDIQDQAAGAFQDRRIAIESCDASLAEEEVFRFFTEMHFKSFESNEVAGKLFKTVLEKSLFSSPAACLKSIEERIRKLKRGTNATAIQDIDVLEEFTSKLKKVRREDFSRYIKLLTLLRDPDYDWSPSNNKDRIVIFTERIETMRYLAQYLREDLGLNKDAVTELYGGMSDTDQQRVVEECGRDESPMRILVASDVASEGINLHYLSHRLIHFDIPWSLMVFQQRNGRIDRYGQKEKPDIRYLRINSTNEKIRGDMRILEILIQKEEQAYKNIGDPAVLMKVYDAEAEEQITAQAMVSGEGAVAFDKMLSLEEAEFDPLALLLGTDKDEKPGGPAIVTRERTLLSDLDYLKTSLNYFTQKERIKIEHLHSVPGIEIELSKDLRRRLNAVLPSEAMPSNDLLRLSSDKTFCMAEMQRSLQNAITENAWPATQYLWPLHPIFDWVNDKSGVLYGRQEAPVLGIPMELKKQEAIFLVAGLIPNRKAIPMVHEWFGLHFSNGKFMGRMTMEEVLNVVRLDQSQIPNRNIVSAEHCYTLSKQLPEVVSEARKLMSEHWKAFKTATDPKINEELDKLSALQGRHHQFILLSLFEMERKKDQELRRVDAIFSRFVEWVRETMELDEQAYIRIIAVMTGLEE